MRLAVVQTSPSYLNREKNLAEMEKQITQIRSDLIVFPELATSGYNFQSKKDLKKVAENAFSGPSAKRFQRMASRKKAALVVGFPEQYRGQYYNSALVVTPKEINVYRKAHLFLNEKKFFSPGRKSPQIYTWKGIRFGVMICFDWYFPEMCRTLALKGADIVAHPSNLVLPYAPRGMRTRSLENLVFSATANRVGEEFNLRYTGQSQICGTRGELKGRLGKSKPGVLSVHLEHKEARLKNLNHRNHIFRDRQPKIYLG